MDRIYRQMYAQIVKWTVKRGTLDRVYEIVGESLEDVMRRWPEFLGYYDVKTSDSTAVVVLLYNRPPSAEALDERLEKARRAIAEFLIDAEVLGRGDVIRSINPES